MDPMIPKTFFRLLLDVLIVIYLLITILISSMGSSLQYEFQIDGGEIKDVCDVLRSFVIDDIRGFVAIASLFAITPVLYYCIKIKFKTKIINALLILFSCIWIWNYLVKYRNCLEFYIYSTN